uniref:Mitotic checkpoint serine/threonine-protein kinase BUB1 beta-like n=1 Tax=Astyanax mexicanus TaxID=7994 RepID=W5KYA8_ASTMX
MEKDPAGVQTQRSCRFNPVERVIPSSGNGPQEEHDARHQEQPGNVQAMYCLELVSGGDTEFSFEELRAQRYFKQLNEKVLKLTQVKQDLKAQIEHKQKLIQERNGTNQHQMPEVRSVSVGSIESAAPKIYSEPEVSSNGAMKNNIIRKDEDIGKSRNSFKQNSSQVSKPFTVYERPKTRSFSASHKALTLPTPILKSRQRVSEGPSDKDASISCSEEAIINGHWNKTLCKSPDDTYDFAHAAQLASTPFGGTVRQNTSEGGLTEDSKALNKTASVIFKEPKSDVIAEPKKLSPIEEISHDWSNNTYSAEPEAQGRATASENTKVDQSTSRRTETTPVLEVNPCSLTVRQALLANLDLGEFVCFNRKAGPLPEPKDDLHLDGETLFFREKKGDLDKYVYCSSGGNVLVKVDESAVPWDFYISSQLRARLPSKLQHCHAQSTCYLYENGSFTVWKVPQGKTIQDLLEEGLDRREVPLLAVQLLEMVKQMHSCRLVHGALRTDELMLCNSCEDSVVIGTDFSSSLDLELQPEVKTVQALPSAQKYISQGLMLPTASPYQVDLCGIAEIVHLLLVGNNMKFFKEDCYWRLADDIGCNISEPLGLMWEDFFHNLLNPEDKPTECVLSNLINKLKNSLFEDLECPFSL